MARIYADMFILDVSLSKQYGMRRVADTSKVYAAVFAKYGYDEDDFLRSQEKYLKDPGRYVRILNKAQKILQQERKVYEDEAKKLRERMSVADRKAQLLRSMRTDFKFWPDTIWRVTTIDSLTMPFAVNVAGVDTIVAKVPGDTLATVLKEEQDVPAVETLKEAPKEMLPMKIDKKAVEGKIDEIVWDNAEF